MNWPLGTNVIKLLSAMFIFPSFIYASPTGRDKIKFNVCCKWFVRNIYFSQLNMISSSYSENKTLNVGYKLFVNNHK